MKEVRLTASKSELLPTPNFKRKIGELARPGSVPK
jgi:hypothetical protein